MGLIFKKGVNKNEFIPVIVMNIWILVMGPIILVTHFVLLIGMDGVPTYWILIELALVGLMVATWFHNSALGHVQNEKIRDLLSPPFDFSYKLYTLNYLPLPIAKLLGNPLLVLLRLLPCLGCVGGSVYFMVTAGILSIGGVDNIVFFALSRYICFVFMFWEIGNIGKLFSMPLFFVTCYIWLLIPVCLWNMVK